MQRFSAIDIGSNAIRMIIGEVIGHKLQIIKKVRAPIRLGHDVFTDGRISDKTLMEACLAFKKFAALNKKYRVLEYKAVATSAVREAKNQLQFVKKINSQSKIKIDVINGKTEAELIFSAVNKEVNLTSKRVVLIDIGGGSVEVTFCENQKITKTKSFPLGTVRMIELLNKQNLSESHLSEVLTKSMGPLLKYIKKETKHLDFDFAVGTGGNLEAMAKLKSQLLRRKPSAFVTRAELAKITQILKRFTVAERINKLGLRPDRADVIVPAILLTKIILKETGTTKVLIPYVGLRDGLLLSVAHY